MRKTERTPLALAYVSKPKYSTSIGDSRYFSNKFKYQKENNLYICPEGQKLYCTTKKDDTKEKNYRNIEACSNCEHKSKCTTAKNGKVLKRNKLSDVVDIIINRFDNNKELYKQR